MLYYLHLLKDYWFPFNLFRYITFRTAMAIYTAFFISFLTAPRMISKLKDLKMSSIREDVPRRHLQKAGTPSMGGLIVLASLLITSALWARWDNFLVPMVFSLTVAFAALGFVDDFLKVKRGRGLSARVKFLCESVISIVFSCVAYHVVKFELGVEAFSAFSLPFIDRPVLDIGSFYILFAAFVIVATVNAVNLTDGLDGLAVSSVATVGATFAGIAYLVGHFDFARYLKIIYVPGAGELTVLLASLVGASLGFLWYNIFPAQVFMGDTGSLSLGATLAGVAILSKQEILLAVSGGVFVVETLSVIVQVLHFKITGKRIFKMAPIHHHFELKGWQEPTIIVRFWVITILLSIFSFVLLKMR